MWDAFKDFIFWCISFFYSFFGDWGMAIVTVTIIFRLLVYPLMQKQIKSSFQMQKVQPLLKEIQTKYADDQQRMQEEMQKIYAEAKFNPIAGCLPIFLQMPIFIALFQVLQEMTTRTQGSTYQFYHLVPDLTLSPSSAFGQGVLTFIPYIILLLIFAGATFAPMILQQRGQADSAQKRQTIMMSGFMSLFMLFIGWTSPAGVLLFWGASSLFGVAQQQITMRVLKREDEAKQAEVIETKPVEVDVTRKVKKKRPTKTR
ncbi:preprotein translocase subunit YidC [Cryptobacterium curtum DSM 15641]|uniref:Membrane protein insertase YidC n=1 Tax=Cryptobacterium curtum (strain ATCC 700683 / DSM 15641 / CCUG 43107 / 12-3) TaxID=469378 RepID=C7MLX4_CRYCD|nr:YidC/Oxa1 family membrane protein insertase [Cryptobacterium curtum]ACU95090.1 preprotein translocase subunit YidC [Cryptobacterium curtum DSM 15641]